jgi:hypothetical protein
MNGIRSARESGRTTTVGVACAVALCCALAAIAPATAAARRHPGHAMARSAGILASIVKRSAHAAGRGHSSGVVTQRCCGWRLLDVYYRARPHKRAPWHGTYELTLRRRGRFLESVGISFFPTAASWAFGGKGLRLGPRYQFTITSPRHGEGWRVTMSDSFVGCPSGSGPAKQCEGFSDELSMGERQLRRRQFRALFGQALRVLRKARRHVPISSGDVVSAGLASRAARAAAASA